MNTLVFTDCNMWLRMLTTAPNRATSGIHVSPKGAISYWISA